MRGTSPFNTCANCGERQRACECGDFLPEDALFDDPEADEDED
jgi:hypothetical protein